MALNIIATELLHKASLAGSPTFQIHIISNGGISTHILSEIKHSILYCGRRGRQRMYDVNGVPTARAI